MKKEKIINLLFFLLINTLALPAAFACPPWQENYKRLIEAAGKDDIIVARHRGDFSTYIPENSILAFNTSYKNCRVAVETDVRKTSDGTLVIFHDTHIGKMTSTNYDPLLDTGDNPRLNELTIEELRKKRLIEISGNVSHEYIPTVREMLIHYLLNNGGSMIFLEIKEPSAIIETAKLVTDIAKEEQDDTLLKRVIIKFNMSEYPTPEIWYKALEDAKASSEIMANPVIHPNAAKRINDLDIPIPNPLEAKGLHQLNMPMFTPSGLTIKDKASRAVALWALEPNSSVPNIEVVIKDSSDFLETRPTKSVQGEFELPHTLNYANTRPGSMASMVAIIKERKKALGTFIPVPDYILWRIREKEIITDITVPNTFGNKKNIDIVTAFFNNTSSCCYALKDRLDNSYSFTQELKDLRMNLAWNSSIGANVITTDDSNSVELFYFNARKLTREQYFDNRNPEETMNSALSWELGYWDKPKDVPVLIKMANGEFLREWGGPVCLYKHIGTDWNRVAKCGKEYYGKGHYMTTSLIETKLGLMIQIRPYYSPNLCLSGENFIGFNAMRANYWVTDCNEGTTYEITKNNNLRTLYWDMEYENRHYDYYLTGYYYGKENWLRTGYTFSIDSDTLFSRWKIERAIID